MSERTSQEERIRKQVFEFLDKDKISLISKEPKDKSDSETIDEASDWEKQTKKRQLKEFDIRLDSLERLEKAKISYAKRIFSFVVIWCTIILILVVCNGLNWLSISEKVLIVLISSTTLNIIGLFTFVLKYMYHTPTE